MTDLSTKYMGLELKNPIVVGSSGLTKSAKAVEQCADAGAGAVVLKSIFEEQIVHQVEELASSAGGMWHPEADEYITAYGRESAVADFLELIKKAKKSVSIPVIASVHCVSAGAWTEFAGKLEDAGADAIELNVLNLSSDPRLTGPEKERVYHQIVEAVKEATKIPLALKIGQQFSSPAHVLTALSESGVDSLTLFNRPYNPDFDIEKLEVVPAKHLSNPDEYVSALRWISILAGKVNCDLAAATGIHDGAAAIKQLLAGAAAVQAVSTFYQNGLSRLEEMLSEIESWMKRSGFETLGDFRGKMSQSQSENPAAFERVQFMKHSVGIE